MIRMNVVEKKSHKRVRTRLFKDGADRRADQWADDMEAKLHARIGLEYCRQKYHTGGFELPKRGSSVPYSLECGCQVIVKGNTNGLEAIAEITRQCPLHKSTPILFEALEGLVEHYGIQLTGEGDLECHTDAVRALDMALVG